MRGPGVTTTTLSLPGATIRRQPRSLSNGRCGSPRRGESRAQAMGFLAPGRQQAYL